MQNHKISNQEIYSHRDRNVFNYNVDISNIKLC